MTDGRPKLSFFLDNNVPDSIGRYLQGRGHSVHRQRHHIPHDSPDAAVGMTALQAERILVSWDKDFNNQSFRQPRFAGLSRVSLSGEGPTLLPAIKEHIDVVEFQMPRAPRSGRMVAFLKVGNCRFKTD